MSKHEVSKHEELPPNVGQDDLDVLVTDLYQKLRLLARGQKRRAGHISGHSAGHSAALDTTAIVHEAYVRLARTRAAFVDGEHFLATATKTMRNLLVDHARRRLTEKRGGGAVVSLNEQDPAHPGSAVEAEQLLDLDLALAELATEEPRMVQIIEARFFAGLTERTTAEGLGLTERTVRREWVKARDWLEKRLD